MALQNLSSNKRRSFLTMLGVIIGVGAVITLVSLGKGATNQITESISAMGSNLVIVAPTRENPEGIDEKIISVIKEASPYIHQVAPVIRGEEKAEVGRNTLDISILGCTPEYTTVRNYPVAYGRFLEEADQSARRRVAVIGSSVAQELFPGMNPLGEEIKVGRVRLEIIGVLAAKGESGFGNADYLIMTPLSTAQQRIFGAKSLSEISIAVQSAEYVDYTCAQINRALLDEFADEDEYRLSNMSELLDSSKEMTGTMTMLLAGIAGISLLVGGIGIMNIMLVSVTERIREIGIRKAIGAQPEEIMLLFLLEAVILSLLGGVIGILTGAGFAIFLGKLLGWTITVSFEAVAVAFTFSLLVGLFFGVFPAYKAGRLNPIEALRHE